MRNSRNIASMPDLERPIALAVGTFDGVHLGHRHLLNSMKEFGTVVVFTFTNHPLEVLKPGTKIPLISPSEYKLILLEDAGVDFCLIQPFSHDISKMSYNLFIEEIYTAFPFDHLFFGGEDVIGRDRGGTPTTIGELAKAMDFTPHYVTKTTIDGEIVCSSLIREKLSKGKLKDAEKLLGRPYCAYTLLKEPYIDSGLLKPGTYTLEASSPTVKFNTKGKVNNDGSIDFERPKNINEEEYATITFRKK